MATYAASGGYYISAPADEIWAQPGDHHRLDRHLRRSSRPSTARSARSASRVDGVGTTPLSGQLRIDRPLGEEARALLQSTVEHGYEEFLERVANGPQEDARAGG